MSKSRIEKYSTTTQNSAVKRHAPLVKEIKKAIEVCSNSFELMDYLLIRLTEKVKSVGLLDDAHEMLDKIREYRDVLSNREALRGDRSRAWSGDPDSGLSDFEILQRDLAQEAQELIGRSLEGELQQAFALSDTAQFLRGYSEDGLPLDAELLQACDNLFNAWLAENDMIIKSGQIYDSTEKGELIGNDGKPLDSEMSEDIRQNKAKKADAQKIKQLLNDPNKGFIAYLAKRGISLKTTELPYVQEKQPAQAKTKDRIRQAVKKKAVEQPKKVEPKEEQPSVKPEELGGTSIKG